jgi:hypothetical protein
LSEPARSDFQMSIAQIADNARQRHRADFYPAEISRLGVIAAENACGLETIHEIAYAEQDRRVAAQVKLGAFW